MVVILLEVGEGGGGGGGGAGLYVLDVRVTYSCGDPRAPFCYYDQAVAQLAMLSAVASVAGG